MNEAQARKAMLKQEKEWRAQSDLSTLQAAQAIQSDKSRLSAAQAQAKKQINVLSKVAPKITPRTKKGK